MNIEHFKQRLLDKQRELVSEITRLEGEARASGEGDVGDQTDAASATQAASESLQEDALASHTLVEVQDALRRIEDGTYGKCTRCGREIEPVRLEAIPWARYCLKDQERQDRAEHVPQGGTTL
jgi:DnaK suppressor protein